MTATLPKRRPTTQPEPTPPPLPARTAPAAKYSPPPSLFTYIFARAAEQRRADQDARARAQKPPLDGDLNHHLLRDLYCDPPGKRTFNVDYEEYRQRRMEWLTRTEFDILAAILRRMGWHDGRYTCWPSMALIAREAGLRGAHARKTVQRFFTKIDGMAAPPILIHTRAHGPLHRSHLYELCRRPHEAAIARDKSRADRFFTGERAVTIRHQLMQLDADHALGRITAEQHAAHRAELEKALLGKAPRGAAQRRPILYIATTPRAVRRAEAGPTQINMAPVAIGAVEPPRRQKETTTKGSFPLKPPADDGITQCLCDATVYRMTAAAGTKFFDCDWNLQPTTEHVCSYKPKTA